jgi:predicted dienelactone hydrolase
MAFRAWVFVTLTLALATAAPGASVLASTAAPSVPAVDAPRLAALGPFAVGVQSLTMVQPDQADVLGYDAATKSLPRRDRVLPVDVWYPGEAAPGMARATYSGALTGENGKAVAFSTPGIAAVGLRPARGAFPLVILAHGYDGTPAAMTWLAENLASKGYVVVAPHFRDPPYGDASGLSGPLTRRPLDIVFVAAEAQTRARARSGVFASADASRTVLIGYSMGGYGVLTAAGARLSPALAPVTHGALAPFVAGGAEAETLKVKDLKAVVAISPAGLFGAGEAWGPTGLAGVTAPSLFIVGSQDKLVGYDPGVKTLWGQAVHAPRYLLTFENGGHSIGMNGAPETMRGSMWDQDWFEDPVWRKERVIGVELHFITAFLDRYVKGDEEGGGYLDVPSPLSNDGVWPAKPGDPYAGFSPGTAPITVWKGFQRSHSAGLELRFAPAG